MPSAVPEPTEALLAHLDFVRSLARSLIGDDGDDIAQDAWVAAMRHPPREAAGLRGFLASTVRNLVRNWRRGRLRRARHEGQAAPGTLADPAAEVVAREALRREVVDAVLALEEPYRATVLHVYFDGLTAAEIARRAGVPAATVRSRLARGLQMLRQRLDREHGARAAWAVPLAPLARTSPLLACPGAFALGGFIMAKKVAVALALVLLVAALVVGLALQGSETSPTFEAADVPQAAHAKERQARDSEVASQAIATERIAVSTGPEVTDSYPITRRLAKLTGVVVDYRTGEGVEGAAVRVRSIAGNPPPGRAFLDDRNVDVTVVSAAGGTFSCEGLPEGPFEARATAKDGRVAKRWFAVTPQGHEGPVRLELTDQPPPAELLVVVDDERGMPVQGACVEFAGLTGARKVCGMDGEPPVTAMTDAAGAAILRGVVQDGMQEKGVLFASVPDGRRAFARTEWSSSRKTMRLRLAAPARLHGRLTGMAEDAVSGDEVAVHALNTHGHLFIPSYGRTFSAPVIAGRFSFEGLPAGRVLVTLRSPAGRRLALRRAKDTGHVGERPNFLKAVVVDLVSGAEVEQDLAVAAGGAVAGTVRDATGRAVPGARVRVVDAGSIEGVGGRQRAADAPVWDLIDDRYDPVRRLDPQVGAEVRTDEGGRYSVRGLQPGPHWVEVTVPGLTYESQVCEVADGTTAELHHTLARAGALQAVLPEGLYRIAVVAVGGDRAGVEASLLEPVFTFPGLAPGDYDVEARTDAEPWRNWRNKVLARATIIAGRTTWMDLRRSNTVAHAGVVVDADGPVAGVRVGFGGSCAVTDERGRFAFDYVWALPPSCNLQVVHEGARYLLSLRECSDPGNLVLRLPDHEVTMQTLDPLGDPVAAVIELSHDDAEASRKADPWRPPLVREFGVSCARSGANGTVLFRHLPPGTFRATMRCADGSAMAAKFSVPASEPIVMRARAVGVVEFLVVDPQGLPIAGNSTGVSTWIGDGAAPDDRKAFGQHAISVHGTTGTDGRAVLRDVPAGEIRAATSNGARGTGPGARSPTTVTQSATLEPGQRLILRLTTTR